jgi:hypothetical protein
MTQLFLYDPLQNERRMLQAEGRRSYKIRYIGNFGLQKSVLHHADWPRLNPGI